MKLLILLMLFGVANLHGVLISKPPHEKQLPKTFSYGRIVSADDSYEEIIYEKVKEFDFSNYDIYLVHKLGKFFLDSRKDFIKDNLRKNMPWEGYIAYYVKTYAKPGTLALDVGAHIGSHTLTMSRAVGPEGQVIAFEPQPKTFCELFMNTEINFPHNVTCFWGALGDKNMELTLPNFYPQVETTYIFDFYNGSSENIAPMVTLDSLILSNISFMKVDVDGCEEIFLEGARETIARNRPVILMEICGGGGDRFRHRHPRRAAGQPPHPKPDQSPRLLRRKNRHARLPLHASGCYRRKGRLSQLNSCDISVKNLNLPRPISITHTLKINFFCCLRL